MRLKSALTQQQSKKKFMSPDSSILCLVVCYKKHRVIIKLYLCFHWILYCNV